MMIFPFLFKPVTLTTSKFVFVLKVVGVEMVLKSKRTAAIKAKIKDGMQNDLAIL